VWTARTVAKVEESDSGKLMSYPDVPSGSAVAGTRFDSLEVDHIDGGIVAQTTYDCYDPNCHSTTPKTSWSQKLNGEKNHQRKTNQLPLPHFLVPGVAKFVDEVRPVLLHGIKAEDRGKVVGLWINKKGEPMTGQSISKAFKTVVRRFNPDLILWT